MRIGVAWFAMRSLLSLNRDKNRRRIIYHAVQMHIQVYMVSVLRIYIRRHFHRLIGYPLEAEKTE